MKQARTFGLLKKSFQLFFSVSLATYLLSMGSLAHASGVTRQASLSKCPTIPTNFDFAHASNQELHRYLLPAHPLTSDQQGTSDWQKTVAGDIQTGGICVPDMKTSPVVNNGRPVKSAPALVNCNTVAPLGTQCSFNWNGYVEGDGTDPGFNEVVGKWNVECVTGSQSPSDSLQSSWVGLGGFFRGENLWQVGSGWSPSFGYFLWYEAVGQNGTPAEVEFARTNCGDHIAADIWFSANAPSSGLGYVLTDNGTSYRGTAPSGFTSGHVSAEWIDERPACGDSVLFKLADYNFSEWTHAFASPNNPTAGFDSIGQLAHTRLWMEDNDGSSTRIAWADALGSENGSGTDNYQAHWEANGSSQCG